MFIETGYVKFFFKFCPDIRFGFSNFISMLLCNTNQTTGFYMKYNTGLKLVNLIVGIHLQYEFHYTLTNFWLIFHFYTPCRCRNNQQNIGLTWITNVNANSARFSKLVSPFWGIMQLRLVTETETWFSF